MMSIAWLPQMKQFSYRLIWLAFIPILSGCSRQSPREVAEEKKEAAEREYAKSLAASVQKQGLMSSDEWMEIYRLNKIAVAKRGLDDGDFQRLIDLVQQRPSGISPSTSVVAVHMGAMSVFQSMTRASPIQKRKIISAVTPLLDSQNRYERSLAEQVLNEFKASS